LSRETVKRTQFELIETLGHWKDGTKPGDSYITDGDVARAIGAYVDAVVKLALERFVAELDAQEHRR